jgi:hypothetical protein
VRSYFVEVYVPRSHGRDASAAAAQARAAAAALSREGRQIRYVRTTFLPDDETCFHLFEAGSAEVVEAVVERAELGRARVVAAVEDS